ncbi:hypothetical protein SteCoe_26396 [Stentor coeruleus]|uniref:Uncharacterized protein n=1 Tax=Stentor coeruleus TaxID=5963 RepID=A0A1R2BCZ7_9CILI|nr:hypothetical protein SteCoe_26396 [Stentor coeruleus]
MGVHNSKHINIENVPEPHSSREFVLQRKLHYKNEFNYAKQTRTDEDSEQLDENSEQLDENSEQLDEDSEGDEKKHKRTTFLEPPKGHDEMSKDIFRQRSLKSEMNEFTFAKIKLEEKKKKHHLETDKSIDSEKKNNKLGKKVRKHSHKRNKSHEHEIGSESNIPIDS